MNVKDSRPSFVFLAHWVESWNWLLWWSEDLRQNPLHAPRWRVLAPLYLVMSVAYLFGQKAYDVVDRFVFKNVTGETWLIRAFAWHFLRRRWQKKIRTRILRAVLDAQERGINVIGLGALVKAEWLTGGGEWIVRTLGGRLTTPIVHGDTLTAATVIHRALELMTAFSQRNRPIFLTGATSKIGRAVALALVRRGHIIKMYTKDENRFREIQAESGKNAHNVIWATVLEDGADCGLWITGKAEPSGAQLLRHLPHRAVVLNFSVPDPLTIRDLRRRPDTRHFDGGLLGYDPHLTSLCFTMRLRRGLTYACHAGTMVHAVAGWTHHEVGPVEIDQLDKVWNMAARLGFELPEATSHLRRVVIPAVEAKVQLPVPEVVAVVPAVFVSVRRERE